MKNSIKQILVVVSIIGCGCSGDPCQDIPFGIGHQECLNPPPDCTTAGGVDLHGSNDCSGLDAALSRCIAALSRVPEFSGRDLVQPRRVDVDPWLYQATNGDAGTANISKLAITVINDDWTNTNTNPYCHEIIHLNLPLESGHTRWRERGFTQAIDEAGWRNP